MTGSIVTRVAEAAPVARGIRRIEVRAVSGRLPPVSPGAHVVVTTPAGPKRAYSVTEQTSQGGYAICVALDASGRGGSRSMHEDVAVGDLLVISPPKNAFALHPAASYLFIAGGIGITPIRAMYDAVPDAQRLRLLYLARSPDTAAYAAELDGRPGVRVHYSAAGRADLWDVLAAPDDDTHVYCCASTAVMEQVRLLTMHWNPAHIHFEDFAGVAPAPGESFSVLWLPEGREIEIGADQSLLRGLREAGIAVDSSCESGTCGTCVLRLVDGQAVHRDMVLTPAERRNRIISCVSRGHGQLALSRQSADHS